ncbi:DUF1294 domain-containing protein [Bacillus sp. 31A1R]|uniref:DUF1294 domain-containing protein n=1 Tax=Robertmurraya mangrovi TaxID=3098077 RepID=A0ABU5IZD5_9BACI|nr:DUF1294 domain-containing protein [Bacillus sp. 31A1R]MDZ5472462.1 DUF1294 domain-containing protein [Bacillus sp. 31A1R]
MLYIVFYLVIINLIGFYIMFADKQKAKKQQYRIQEKTIWMVAFIGGAAGAMIGMNTFRHKTKHTSFKWGLPSLTIIEIIVILWLADLLS